MSERSLSRIGAVSAVVGAILAVVVNLLHPRSATLENPEAFLRMIAESRIWVGDHVGVIFAGILFTGGLIAISRSITEQPGAAWARLGFAGALVSVALLFVLMATDGIAIKALARAWMNAQAAEKAAAFNVGHALATVNLALFSVWIIVFWGVTIILYGLAVMTSHAYPKWLGWVAILAGLGSAWIGLRQAYTGPSFLVSNVLFVIFSLIITLWLLVMGVLLWFKTNSAR